MRRALLPLLFALIPSASTADPLADLGRALFFDTSLSANGTQSCASCHQPANGFAPASTFPQGALTGRFGTRKPPSIAYQAVSPPLHHLADETGITFIGGDMADGRATGAATGNPAAEQALLPLLNPDEMALPHSTCAAALACATAGDAMERLEPGVCRLPQDAETLCAAPAEPDPEAAARALALLGRALAAYEASPEVMRFSSRFDAARAGQGSLTPDEAAGLALFDGKAKCSACHVLTAGPDGRGPLFTDFTYDNLGVPRNPANPAYAAQGPDWLDAGLAATLQTDPLYAAEAAGVRGAFKVPTLRNVHTGQPRTYMHNGWFETLEGVVRFYNTRDVWPPCRAPLMTEPEALAARCWPAPETPATMNRDELGNLKLSSREEAQIVAFLKTLTDG